MLMLLYAIVAARAWWEARQELMLGRASLGAKEPDEAIVHFGRALRWYTPGSSANRAAVEHLLDLARQAEAAGNVPRALDAYRQLRGGIYAIRSLWTPYGEVLPAVNAHIARAMAGQGTRNAAGDAASAEQREAEHLRLLARDPGPSPFFSLLAVLAFLVWVGAAFAAIQLGLDESGRLRGRPMFACLGVGLPAFTLWLIGLALA